MPNSECAISWYLIALMNMCIFSTKTLVVKRRGVGEGGREWLKDKVWGLTQGNRHLQGRRFPALGSPAR